MGLPKKSLDDYLSQLRQARDFGYNFNEYCDQKIGHMRQFVKQAIAAKKG